MKQKKKEKTELEKSLKSKIDDAARQKKSRDAKRIKLDAACEKNPDLRAELKIRKQSGRPRIESDQTDLFKTIIDIATHGSAVDEKRRSSDCEKRQNAG